jgi:hypothetical protein
VFVGLLEEESTRDTKTCITSSLSPIFLFMTPSQILDEVMTADGRGMRHYVVRTIAPSMGLLHGHGQHGLGAPPRHYRCGSLGPYEDLEDLLFEISSHLKVVKRTRKSFPLVLLGVSGSAV